MLLTHPLGLYKYNSEKLEKFLPLLHFQKALLQEARLEPDPKPSSHWQLNF